MNVHLGCMTVLVGKQWSLGVVYEAHNHPMELKLEGRILVGHLNDEEKNLVSYFAHDGCQD